MISFERCGMRAVCGGAGEITGGCVVFSYAGLPPLVLLPFSLSDGKVSIY